MTKNLNATVKDASQEFASIESRVGTLVENKIKVMIESVMLPTLEQKRFQMKGDIIEGRKQDYINGRPAKQPETVANDNQVKLPQRRKSLRLNPLLNSYLLPSASLEKMFEMELFPVSEIPSFSLGLSQEDNHDDLVTGFTAEQIAVVKDSDLDLQECKRSKRPKTVTHGLVDVFQCSPDILNRARDAQMVVYGKADSWEYTQKYTKLAQKLKSQFVINLGGCQVSNKDIMDIVARARPYSSKVMDVLMKHLTLSYGKQSRSVQGKRSVFFYTKFVASMSSNYSKFSKIPYKETHMFKKGLVEVFGEMTDHHPDEYRFYFPFNLEETLGGLVCGYFLLDHYSFGLQQLAKE
ncbi:hypothetical protein Rs2_28970 [Raphanus sativus]|nr:hypothetical protein Rs2_28970 [Raphanus sativus]